VRRAFVGRQPADATCFRANDRGRWQADLYGLARRRLRTLGVTSIFGGGYCTYGDPKRFYSYRRDPECGRMVSVAAIRTLEK